jgi:tetratricopeptide (TPR) repeat protein
MTRTLLILCLLCGSAAAQESPKATMMKARVQYFAAEAAYKAGEWDKAIAGYQAAFDLSKRPLLLYNVAQAWRRKAETTGASEDRRQALAAYERYVDADPSGKAAGDARARIDELRRASEPPPAPIPEPKPEPQPAPPAAVVPEAAPAPMVDDANPSRTWRIAGITTGAVGVVLVAGGVYFGLQAKSKSDELDALQRGDMWNQDLYDSGKAAERNMYIFFSAGAAAIVTGAVFYFVVGKAPPVETAIVPTTGGAGLVVWGSF